EGDQVSASEPLVQLETEKVNVEVAAERAGVLERISHLEGATVQPGDVLAVLADGTAERPADGGAGAAATAVGRPAANGAPATAPPPGEVGGAGSAAQPAAAAAEPPRVSPEARRLAEERGVDLSKLSGSGP